MLKNILILAALSGVLVACGGGGGGANGIASLGSFFARAFAQDRNAEPLSLAGQTLTLTPTTEPFNP